MGLRVGGEAAVEREDGEGRALGRRPVAPFVEETAMSGRRAASMATASTVSSRGVEAAWALT